MHDSAWDDTCILTFRLPIHFFAIPKEVLQNDRKQLLPPVIECGAVALRDIDTRYRYDWLPDSISGVELLSATAPD